MGQAFRVNGYQNNWQRNPVVTTFDDGGFLIVYESYINDYGDGPVATAILAQRYDSDGEPVGFETLVFGADGTSATDAGVATLDDGGYVVTWVYDDYDDILTIRERVFVRAFDADGTPRTEILRVDTVPADDAGAPEVFATANGSLFAALSSGVAICPFGVMVLSEVAFIVFVRAS
ncbi:hypothetical protein [Oceaniglobus indicus]|uniref:hypothetical protein n=1 Tax=Oceaniglobus indicus TaxID=2047749 RepID=UPI000C197D1D|nr:hypothetical protein [Oceaniglobus indicus]